MGMLCKCATTLRGEAPTEKKSPGLGLDEPRGSCFYSLLGHQLWDTRAAIRLDGSLVTVGDSAIRIDVVAEISGGGVLSHLVPDL